MLRASTFRVAAALASPRPLPHQLTSVLAWSRCNLRYASTTVKVPQMAESITEGTLKQFYKKVGDYVEADEEIANIETDKVDVAVSAPESGTIKELLVKEDDTVTVGQEIAQLEIGEKPAETDQGSKESKEAEEPKQKEEKQETKETAPEPKEEQPKKPEESEPPPPPPPPPKKEESKQESKPAPPPKQERQPAQPSPPKKRESPKKGDEDKQFSLWSREERRVKMNRMRLRIAERLKQAQNTAASLSTFQEVDMSSMIDFRNKYKDEYLKKTGIKIGFMGAFAQAATLAMKDIPAVNAAIEGPNGGDTIVYHDYVDISVAVATEKGLTTPIVRNVESMNLLEIEKVISDLGKKARDGKLTIEDMAGGTFTISNGGVFGSLMSTPIINPPQAAVLGLHAIFNRAVPIDGKIEIRPMMNVTLTYDHRLIDGREAATFLVKVKQYIQDPRRMLLG